MRRTLLALILLLAASPLTAYVIIFKDGTRLEAREKYKVQGKLAIITLPGGATTTYPFDKIDVAKTNATNIGSGGTVIDGGGGSFGEVVDKAVAEALNPEKQSNLSTYAGKGLRPPPARVTPKPTAAPPAGKAIGRTYTGSVDFLREPRVPAADMPLASTVGELLRQHGLANAGIYKGSQPRRLLVEVAANSEGGVFQAIGATAQAMLEAEAKKPGALEALELFIATDHRQRAGQFLITAERARELVSKQLDLTAFYLKYVEF
jgi:hypothetical protein